LRDMSRVFITVCFDGTSLGATNTGRSIKSERIAITNSSGVFAANIIGAEAIAEGCAGK
jgi:hypothetical protein